MGASCTAENYAHALILQMVFSVIIFIFINIARAILINGIVRVMWQWLNTGYFTYLATCTRRGVHTYDEAVLADRVEAMFSKMILIGFAMIAFAIMMQVPWIIALGRFTDIAYKPQGTVIEVDVG